MVKITVNN